MSGTRGGESRGRAGPGPGHSDPRAEILRLVAEAGREPLPALDHAGAEEMKRRGALLTEAGRLLSRHKAALAYEAKQECFDAIQAARRGHDGWWQGYGRVLDGRRAGYEANVRQNLERNRERYATAVAALERHRTRVAGLRAEIAVARSPEWAERARGWVVELEKRIAEVEATVERVGGWIKEDEKRLSELR